MDEISHDFALIQRKILEWCTKYWSNLPKARASKGTVSQVGD
jgi:hypothetical protein